MDEATRDEIIEIVAKVVGANVSYSGPNAQEEIARAAATFTIGLMLHPERIPLYQI